MRIHSTHTALWQRRYPDVFLLDARKFGQLFGFVSAVVSANGRCVGQVAFVVDVILEADTADCLRVDGFAETGTFFAIGQIIHCVSLLIEPVEKRIPVILSAPFGPKSHPDFMICPPVDPAFARVIGQHGRVQQLLGEQHKIRNGVDRPAVFACLRRVEFLELSILKPGESAVGQHLPDEDLRRIQVNAFVAKLTIPVFQHEVKLPEIEFDSLVLIDIPAVGFNGPVNDGPDVVNGLASESR